ncbi:MAG: alpha/beta fold hydrolase [Oscillospiraceae bacterium]|nr:alpha/beta fold hydrolase [Oscillospiraceae bacterium]
MFDKFKADILFHQLLKRPDIDKAYAKVPPTDSWYETINKVHESLEKIQMLPHEVVEIQSHDGLTLKAVYYPAQNQTGKAVIFAHGYTSHAEREWAFPGLFYHSLGFNVLIPYQRAHGMSQGKFISFGALEHLDMMKWVEKINLIHPDDSILIHGLSMGGGIVLNLCDKEMKNVKALISDAPNVSIADFFKGICGHVFKKKSEKVLPHVFGRFQREFGVDAKDFDASQIVCNCRYPLLLSAGSMEQREDVFNQLRECNPMDTTIVILPGCNHGNGMYKQTEMFQNAIKTFVDRYIDGR